MSAKWLFLLFISVLFASCSSRQAIQTQVTEQPDPISQPYKIGPDDQLEIFVWKQPQLSGKVNVAGDGTVTIPLAGQMKAAGLNTGQLQDDIAKKLTPYLDDPTVTVRVDDARSQVFYVMGEVPKPGLFRLRSGEVLSQGLAQAGGLGEFADKNKIRIRRRLGEKTEEITINFSRVEKGEDVADDIPLVAGDTITVP